MAKNVVKCLRCRTPMEELLTRRGVLIDVCPSCKGVWLDQGEINFFAQDKKLLHQYETQGLEAVSSVPYECPKCQSTPMQMGRLPRFNHQIEKCLSCHGIYLNAHEFKKLQNTKSFKNIRPDQSKTLKSPQALPLTFPGKFPSLALTTGIVCVSLYGILLLLMIALMEMGVVSPLAGSLTFVALVALQFFLAPILLDWQLKFFGSLNWTKIDDLPPSFKESLQYLCDENRIPIPRVGIIDDGSPQAYTYGRTPYSARVVFSRGMFELLDEEELEAVLAHELGHIKHWDFVIMTLIKLVPLLLYTIYSNMRAALRSKGSNKKSGLPLLAILVVSYTLYLISEYLVLFVSRVREYYADQFSCFATKKPNKLLTALVKVSYGLLSSRPRSDSEKSYEDKRRSVEALNIMSVSRSKQLALAHQEGDENFNPQAIEEIMRWDLWTPWAFYYEIHSTHPLTAKRINAISSYALSMKQKPYIVFNQRKPESYWDDFFIDILIMLLPYILGIVGALAYWGKQNHLSPEMLAASCVGLSLGALIRTLSAYPEGFSRYCVASLLKLIKVSPVRSYPVTLRGHILGRGDAGNIFSEDFVLKDKTGMIFLNHEPFGLNIFFALFRYKKFQGREVKVTGWYRRAPTPYVEVKSIQTKRTKSHSYTYHYKMILCLLGIFLPFCYFYLK